MKSTNNETKFGLGDTEKKPLIQLNDTSNEATVGIFKGIFGACGCYDESSNTCCDIEGTCCEIVQCDCCCNIF